MLIVMSYGRIVFQLFELKAIGKIETLFQFSHAGLVNVAQLDELRAHSLFAL